MTELIDPTCPVVKNMLLLDSDGKRIAVKYYSPEWCVLRVGSAPWPGQALASARRSWIAACQATPPKTGGSAARRALGGSPASTAAGAAPPARPCRSSVVAQAAYEKSVFAKTSRTNARGEGAQQGGRAA